VADKRFRNGELHLEIVRKADVNGGRPLRMMVESHCSPQSSARMISKRR
jgi:hypothetical protein